jgi:hypothetical protein
MQTLQPFKNKFNSFWRCVFAAIVLGAGLGQSTSPYGGGGCATVPQAPLPQSAWGEHYAFSYEPAGATQAAASVPVTIAVVNPNYKVEDSILNNELYRKIGKGLSASMGTDLDKILISKGITTTGPFPSLDEITYSDKKDAALTLAPQVFITVEIKDSPFQQVGNRFDETFSMNVTGWITFFMQEPLSGEKMWIKKLEIEPVVVQGDFSRDAAPQTVNGLFGPMVTGYTAGQNVLYDGRPDALADALKQIYPVVMSQFEKYIDTDELIQLKAKGNEIRASKVFISN